MERQGATSEQRFANRAAQTALAVYGAIVLVMGLSVFATVSRATGGFVLLLGGLWIFRALRSSDVIVGESGVTTRSMVSTRRHRFSELRSVEVAVGTTGFAGFGREHLVFHRVDGRDAVFTELSSRPSKDDELTVVRRAASCINERLPQP